MQLATVSPTANRDGVVLVRELNHRLFNNLQIVVGELRICRRTTTTRAEIEQKLDDLGCRLDAFATLHRLLAYAPHGEILESYCRDISTNLVRAFGREDVLPWVSMIDVDLGPERALKIGLLVTELVTNVLKHSLKSGEGGMIWVELHAASPDELELAVWDDGTQTRQPLKRSPQIVEALTASLSGELLISTFNGYVARVRFPV